jgi:endonuclease YncB( thermonuclease family)
MPPLRREGPARLIPGHARPRFPFSRATRLSSPGQVEVIEGETVRFDGQTFRIVGFDTPETQQAEFSSESGQQLFNRLNYQRLPLLSAKSTALECATSG